MVVPSVENVRSRLVEALGRRHAGVDVIFFREQGKDTKIPYYSMYGYWRWNLVTFQHEAMCLDFALLQYLIDRDPPASVHTVYAGELEEELMGEKG